MSQEIIPEHEDPIWCAIGRWNTDALHVMACAVAADTLLRDKKRPREFRGLLRAVVTPLRCAAIRGDASPPVNALQRVRDMAKSILRRAPP